MRIAIIASLLVLSACATHSQQASTNLGSSLDAMVGQPIETAIARLGEPIGSARMGADSVYGWGQAFASTEFSNAAPGWVEAADAQGGFFPAPRRVVQNDCVIRLVVDGDGLIREWGYHGNDRGCRAYADRLAGPAMARAG